MIKHAMNLIRVGQLVWGLAFFNAGCLILGLSEKKEVPPADHSCHYRRHDNGNKGCDGIASENDLNRKHDTGNGGIKGRSYPGCRSTCNKNFQFTLAHTKPLTYSRADT